MIIASLGKLSAAQVLTGSEISENVIQLSAIDYVGMTDVWWVIDTVIAATVAGTMKFELVMATSAGLGTAIQVCCIDIAAITDLRTANIGRHIIAINIGKQLKDMLHASGSDYPFIGMKNTCAGSTTISINAALSFTEPPTDDKRMSTVSNVDVPDVASPGSGA